MGISPEMLSDAALNVVGYLLAGALLTLLYSSVTHRTGKKSSVATEPTARPVETPAATSARRAEFVDLRTVTAADKRPQTSGRTQAEIQTRQRNRAEVMRLAREMLQSGTPRDNVRTLLPISDGELSMLENQRA